MLSTYFPHQLPIFTELKSVHKKRNIQVIPDIWNFNIVSNLWYFYFDVLFFSSLSFILCPFYVRKVELFFGLFIGLFFLSSNNFIIPQRWNHLGKRTWMWIGNYFFCVFQRNFHQSSLGSFFYSWASSFFFPFWTHSWFLLLWKWRKHKRAIESQYTVVVTMNNVLKGQRLGVLDGCPDILLLFLDNFQECLSMVF